MIWYFVAERENREWNGNQKKARTADRGSQTKGDASISFVGARMPIVSLGYSIIFVVFLNNSAQKLSRKV